MQPCLIVIVQAVLAVVVAGFVLAWRSRPFTPSLSLAAARWFVVGLVAVACPLLVVSTARVWWVVHDGERDVTLVTDGTAPVPAVVVGFGLACAVLTVLAVMGRRNWAPAVLSLAWLVVGWAWAFEASGEAYDMDASGEGRSGLSLATWAMLVLTVAATVGSVLRLAEHRAAGRQRLRGG